MRSVKDTMLCWNPGTDQVKLFSWPDNGNLSRDYEYSGLAAYLRIQELDFEGRKAIAFIEAVHLIVRDKCDPVAVHNAMLELEEYRAGCAEDMQHRIVREA